MYLIRFIILLLVSITTFGCVKHTGFSSVWDYERYDSGEPKKVMNFNWSNRNEFKYSHSLEYFKSGRLMSEGWSLYDRPEVKLTFYENGQLKSEERFLDGQIAYGIYYSEEGKIEQTTGHLLDWIPIIVRDNEKKLP